MRAARRLSSPVSGQADRGMENSAYALREAFLRFFEQRGHKRVQSSRLVPDGGDETLLFTNSGMCQFKDLFLGKKSDASVGNRATTAQKCLRAGGKHNDLENVGFTPRHHTFFEMLGNFSFQDYFKEQAITMGWDFVTKELAIPRERLRVTVYQGDHESEQLWRKIAGPTLPIDSLGKKDNFWSMGDGAGVPCGPCTEIFFDKGEEFGSDIDARYLEIWNIVFMQYRSLGNGEVEPLATPSVDTGMGLERIASVMQGVPSNYETDLLHPLVMQADGILRSRSLGTRTAAQTEMLGKGFAQRVIADHVRSAAFLVADGVVPSNVGRGYVLRRLIRRATGFAFRAGVRGPFLTELLATLEQSFAAPVSWKPTSAHPYPELSERRETIAAVMAGEEEIFFRTVENGMRMLEENLAQCTSNRPFPGDACFKLYDTFGFPADLTSAICAQRGLRLDLNRFEELMEEQRKRSQGVNANMWQFGSQPPAKNEAATRNMDASPRDWSARGVTPSTRWYDEDLLVEKSALVLATASHAEANRLWVSISPCPFYAEGGGQVGDTGEIRSGGKILPVLDSVRPYKGGIALLLDTTNLGGIHELDVGSTVEAHVDAARRKACSVHHTATHILHAALREVAGTQVMQAGSHVSPERLRFDFCHPRPLTSQQLEQIENYVNAFVQQNLRVETAEMELEQAKSADALMLFGEKYDDVVRVVSVGKKAVSPLASGSGISRSAELCGGTHVQFLSQIFPFKIISEGSVSSGTRRIEAVAGPAALTKLEESVRALNDIAGIVRCPPGMRSDPAAIVSQAVKLADREKSLKTDLAVLREKLLSAPSPPVAENKNICVHVVPDLSPGDAKLTTEALKSYAAQVSRRQPSSVHVLICGESRVAFACGDTVGLDASQAMRKCFEEMERRGLAGGKGGGSKALALGQFNHAGKWNEILESACFVCQQWKKTV